jgi:hypothetical protein
MELKSKEAVADDILNKVIANFMNKIFSIFFTISWFYSSATTQLYCNGKFRDTRKCESTGFKTLDVTEWIY